MALVAADAGTGLLMEEMGKLTATMACNLIELVEPGMNVKVMLHLQGEERGLFLKSDPVEEGDIVFKLPLRVAVSAGAFDKLCAMGRTNGVEIATYESKNELKKQLLLLLHASFEPTASPLLRAYHSSLPSLDSFEHLPLNWKRERVAKLGPLFAPMLQSYVDRARKEEASMFSFLSDEVVRLSTCNPLLFSDACIKGLTHTWLFWAFSVTNSRGFDLTDHYNGSYSDEENNPGLLPIMDMMNHAYGAKATVKISVEKHTSGAMVDTAEETYMCARATKDLKANDELCFEYQKVEEILHFLFYYGFLPSERHSESELMYFQIEAFDEAKEAMSESEQQADGFALYSRALQSLGLPNSPTLAIPASAAEPFPNAWIWILRLKAMYEGKCLDQLQDFIDGKVKILVSQEEFVWTSVGETLTEYIKWYEHALSSSGEGTVNLGATVSSILGDARDSDEEHTLTRSILLIAQSVLERAHSIFQSAVMSQ
jgi:hypothetical protein